MKIEFRSDYFSDPAALAAFERYADQVFGLDFGRWKERGLWDSQYVAFSAFVEGECIASICVYPSEMTIAGERRQGAQLLTVGTLPEYRLQGIQRQLWKRARTWISKKYDFTFLFTTDSAAGFYDRLGFTRVEEFSETIPCPRFAGTAGPRIRKLDLERDGDFAIIARLARQREMVSDRIGFHNPNLLLFMFLYVFQNWSYYLEDLDAVAVVEEAEDRVRIHDLLAASMPQLPALAPLLAHFERREIEFLFCPDRLGVERTTKSKVTDDLLFVSDEFDVDGEFIFPASIRA